MSKCRGNKPITGKFAYCVLHSFSMNKWYAYTNGCMGKPPCQHLIILKGKRDIFEKLTFEKFDKYLESQFTTSVGRVSVHQ